MLAGGNSDIDGPELNWRRRRRCHRNNFLVLQLAHSKLGGHGSLKDYWYEGTQDFIVLDHLIAMGYWCYYHLQISQTTFIHLKQVPSMSLFVQFLFWHIANGQCVSLLVHQIEHLQMSAFNGGVPRLNRLCMNGWVVRQAGGRQRVWGICRSHFRSGRREVEDVNS